MGHADFRERMATSRDIHEIKELYRQVQAQGAGKGAGVVHDGWFRPLGEAGFRYDYDLNIANGGWEFQELGAGLSVIMTDMVAQMPTPRRHQMTDHLVMSVVVSGEIPFADPRAAAHSDLMTRGTCTIYGLREGSAVETLYEPGRHLRWVSILIECDRFFEAMGIRPGEVPPELGDFLNGTRDLPARQVPLTQPAVLLSAHAMFECAFEGALRSAYMRAKAVEMVCHLLGALADPGQEHAGAPLSRGDIYKLERALQLVRSSPQQPIAVEDLAHQVGLSRRRLQHGFRLLHGDTVCNVRDKVRMELALDLVLDSDMSMIEIAMETGYEHPASFTRAFKATFGASPIATRKAARTDRVVRRRRTGGRA